MNQMKVNLIVGEKISLKSRPDIYENPCAMSQALYLSTCLRLFLLTLKVPWLPTMLISGVFLTRTQV